LRGVRSRALAQVDLAELGAPAAAESLVVQFTHLLCSACRTLEQRLRSEGRTVVTIDVSSRPELAQKYGVAVVPTAVAVARGGEVTARLAG
jgi:thioredoxin-like negative regulator of GroEL